MKRSPLLDHSFYNRMVRWFFGSRWRLMTVLFFVLAIPFSAVVIVMNQKLSTELEKRVINKNNQIVDISKIAVKEFINHLQVYTEGYAKRKKFSRHVDRRDREDIIQQHLQEMVLDNEQVQRVFIADTNGTLLYDYPVDSSVHGQDFSYRDWYQGVSANDSTYVSEIYQRAALGQPFVMTVATPIFHADTRQLLGYLCAQNTIEELTDWLYQVKTEPDGQLLLIDHRGNLPITEQIGGKERLKSVKDFEQLQPMAGERGVKRVDNPLRSGRSLICHDVVEPYGWTILYAYPVSAIQQPIRALGWFVIGLLGLCFGIIFIIGFLWLDLIRQYHREREKNRKEISQLNEKLEDKVEELEAFTYSVSHDLQAPLRAIHGYTKILMKDHQEELPAKTEELLDVISENTERMHNLIHDLLEFSRLGKREVKQRPVNMKKMVQEVIKKQKTDAHQSVEVILHQLPDCQGDPKMLRQVWSNLVSNALKYSSREKSPKIEIGARTEKNNTVYFVSDNGVGFDPKYAHKLFSVFQRLHSRGEFEGTGVGLALVKRIIDKHGGKVWAESEKGEGTTFYFCLS